MGFLNLIHYCVLNVDGLGDEFVSVLCSVTDSPSTSLVFCHRGNICLCSCVHIGKVLFYKQTYLTRENAEQREKLVPLLNFRTHVVYEHLKTCAKLKGLK